MSRISLLVGLATLLMLGFQPPVQADDDDWKQYQQGLEQSRQQSSQRYEQWQRQQEQRNQAWRDEPGTERDRVLELSDSGLKPGRYTVRLPFGLGLRVNVPEDARAPQGQPAWGDRSYGDVHYRARQITSQLRDLHLELQRAGQTELTAEAAKIYEEGSGLVNAVATRRPAAEIREQFSQFDRLWHPLSHRLARQTEVGTGVQRRAAAIDQLEEGLHQILAISPAPPYDRPLVAALTSELTQRTSHLLEDLKVESQQGIDLHTITLRAQRVKQHAADLNATVRQNAPFATIVEEYEDFDRAWHRLLDQARVSPEVDAHVRRMARQVRQIDLQLHRELYVNVPIVNDRQQLLHLSEGIAKTANHLAEDLDADTGRGKRELLEEARLFASIAGDLNRTLTDRQPAQAQQRAFKELLDSWNRLHAQIDMLKGDRFEHSQAIADQLAADIKRLQTQWREG